MKALFAPFRTELDDCWCDLCSEITLLHNDPLYGVCSARRLHHQELAEKLLAACQSGTHVRKDFRTYTAEQRPTAAGYVARFTMRDYYSSGMGLGVGNGY